MATRLRYNADYGYALAIGDTNTGKDNVPNDKLFGAVDDTIYKKLSFSQKTGYTMNASGWALSKTNSAVNVCCYVDGEFLARADAVARPQIQTVFPAWTNGKSGFSLSMNMSSFSTGNHVLEIFAEDGSERVRLKSVNFSVNNLVYEIESPNTTESICLQSDDMTVSFKGWGYDRSGEPLSFLFSVDGDTKHSLTSQERQDVFEMPGCVYLNTGFSLKLNFKGTKIGTHTVELFAQCKQEIICLATFSINITEDADLGRPPVKLIISQLPDQLEYDFGEPLNLDGLILLAVYEDQSVKEVQSGIVGSASTNAPGEQLAKIEYAGLTIEFAIFVHDPIQPQVVKLTSDGNTLLHSQQMQLATIITPENACAYSVVWESSDPSIASVSDDGVVTGVSRGECEIVSVVYDYYGNEVCRDSIIISVRSVFLSFWIRLWQFFISWFRF